MAVIGFIGTGSMGSALARAAARGGQWDRILLANRGAEKARRLALDLGAQATDNLTAARESDYLMLGVEPAQLPALLDQLRPVLTGRAVPPVTVSMAAGVELAAVADRLGGGVPVIRIMPNIPAAVGAGVILFCAAGNVSADQKALFLAGMREAGVFSELEEAHMKAATGITGCGPAYAAMFAEALADGGVACGVPREKAREYAALTMLGSAKMLLEGELLPETLKDLVCSPGGSTIQGVRALEEGGMRAAVINGVIAAFEKKF